MTGSPDFSAAPHAHGALSALDATSPGYFERLLHAVANNATLALFIMDERQQCMYMNPAAERLTGYTLEEVRGRPLHDVVHHTRPDGRPYPLEECPIDRAFPENNREQGEEVFVHKDGSFYPVAFTASPIREGGGIVGTIIEVRDIRQEKRDQQAREELDRAKTTFFGNISHELRTPLTLMLGPIEDLLSAGDVSSETRGQLTLIHRNALRLLTLVNALLDFTRVEAGRIAAVFERVDLAAFTADLASAFRAAIERAGLRFIVTCETIDEPTYVDREMWEKVVFNLLSNALKFTLAGEIRLSLRKSVGRVVLDVSDTGVGVPPAEVPRLFERFYRVPGTTARSHEGSGIGLALVKELVRLHAGEVDAQSSAGEGTTFTVTIPTGHAHLPPDRISAIRDGVSTAASREAFLPASPSEDREGATCPQTTAVAPLGRVLIVDDNADMRAYMARLLTAHYLVETAADGAEALRIALRHPPDAILSDVMMPGLDGFELVRALREDERTRRVPVIMISARADHESRSAGLEAGADDYLSKPFAARELLARVRVNIDNARLYARAESARKQAEEASRLKDEFLATLSHELRTPLNAIVGWSHLLREQLPSETQTDRALETIGRNARALTQLVEDLLDVSRIITGQMRLDVAAVSLPQVIDAAAETLRPAAQAKDIKIQFLLDPSAGPVFGDAARLQQMMWNLLANAIRFTPREGRVQIRLERLDSYAQITVSDTGRGIAPGFLPYVFDRFRQQDATASRPHGGLGLGLAIVRNIVELHGGDVQAANAVNGPGAVFVVKLPIAAVAAPAPGLSTERTQPTHDVAERSAPLIDADVLVVDDERDARELLAIILGNAGARVRLAASAEEALDSIRRTRPDVLIADIGMPGQDGYALIRQVRELDSESGARLPAIALSAYVRSEDRVRALAAGYQAHMAKPVDAAELTMAVLALTG